MEVSEIIDALTSPERRTALVAMRELLAAAMKPAEHENGCPCECGPPPADGRVLAALSRELRGVLLEIEKLPSGEEDSDLDRIAASVADEQAPGRETRQSGTSAP